MPGKQIIVTICKVVMTLCLALEGVVLAGSGFPYYVHMFPGILVLGLTWLLVAPLLRNATAPFFHLLQRELPLLTNRAKRDTDAIQERCSSADPDPILRHKDMIFRDFF